MAVLTRIVAWLDARFTVNSWVAMPRNKRMRWCAILALEFVALLGLLAVLLGGRPEVWLYVSVFALLACALFAGLAVSPEKTAWIAVRSLVVLIPVGLLAYVLFVLVAIFGSWIR